MVNFHYRLLAPYAGLPREGRATDFDAMAEQHWVSDDAD